MNQRLTPTILRFDSLPSTNTEAARQAAGGAPEGLCIVAREQTAGRGRRERTWVSTKDAGLYFSIVLRPRFDASGWPLITLAAALAVHDALREACGLATDIKWPNDLMASGRKLCGILAETVETKAGRACVVGIGINLNDRAFPKEIAEAATSVEAQTGVAPDAEVLLRALTRSLARYYESLDASDGAARIVREWETRSTYACGLRVSVALVAETFEGTTRGLEPDGALRVETDAHEIRIVRAGDVHALRSEPRRRQM
ncbi:MAG: biotin--[acetyl-CoA-carboxylase] ligase [Acidobacteria bacterium]|nr:biotin--[acetyl-CoA-carboxylase] ligase [Acidobacteriota bacterium]